MADGTTIEWARHPVTGRGASWNPLLARTHATGKVGYHCEHASPGCVNCYAEAFNQRRLPARGTGLSFKPGHRELVDVFLDEAQLLLPLKWRDPRGIFVCSMSDLFGEFVPDALIDRMFAVMALAKRHVFMVLTKRPERMRDYVSRRSPGWGGSDADTLALAKAIFSVAEAAGTSASGFVKWPLPNVWLGTSVEDQRRANERIPELLRTPAAVRFLSAEPLLDRVDLRQWLHAYGCGCGWGGDSPLDYCNECGWRGWAEDETCPDCKKPLADYNACPSCDGHSSDGMSFGPNSSWLHWVIAGFESGRGARLVPEAPQIARSLRDQCAAAGVPFFFKQWGSWTFAPEGMDFDQAMRWAQERKYSLSPRSIAWGGSGGRPSRYEHFPNGRTAFHTGKKGAGRLLDGVEHNAMPEAS